MWMCRETGQLSFNNKGVGEKMLSGVTSHPDEVHTIDRSGYKHRYLKPETKFTASHYKIRLREVDDGFVLQTLATCNHDDASYFHLDGIQLVVIK